MRANITRGTSWGLVMLLGYGTHACLERDRDNPMPPAVAGTGGTAAGGSGGRAGSSSSSGTHAGLGGAGGAGGDESPDSQAGATGEGVTCSDVTCAPEASCVESPTPHCECPEGYTDPRTDGTLCQDIDECAVENGGCDALAACTNTPGSFECGGCPEGYTSKNATCVDIDECAVDNGGCDALTTCTNTAGAHACGSCPHGYTGASESGCVDVDECAANTDGCDPSVQCKNTKGGFTCGDCPAGYTGGGASGCTDIDECKTNNGGCDALTKCTNTPGGFSCGACPAGYSGTGATGCVDINECGTANGGCDVNATCTNTPGSRTCACKTGYSGTGQTCSDVNECATSNGGCDVNATCTNTAGSRTCACKTGYSGTGQTCSDVNECATNNGGCDVDATCTNTNGGRTCACKADYSGNGLACSCALAAPACVNATTQKSCVNDTVTQKTCTGSTCVAGQGCLSCPALRCDSTCCPTPPANASAMCTGTDTCGVKCNTNFHGCNGSTSACYSDTDIQHCGNSCAVCDQPNATNQMCTSGACTYTCAVSLGCLYPNGKPVCGSWDFESSAGVEGFAINTNTTTGSDGTFEVSTKHPSVKSHSLAVGYSGTSTSEAVDVNIPLCPSGKGLDLSGRALSLDIYPEASGALSYGNQNHSWIFAKGSTGGEMIACDGTISEMVPGKSYHWTCGSAAQPTTWPLDVVQLTLHLSAGAPWKGTFYIDNVKIQ